MTTLHSVRKSTSAELAVAVAVAAILFAAKAALPSESRLWPYVYSGFFLVLAGFGVHTFFVGVQHLRRGQCVLGLAALGCGVVVAHGAAILAAFFLWPGIVAPWLATA